MPNDDTLPPPIAFDAAPSLNDTDFIRAGCNSAAHDAALAEEIWPDGRLIITGPAQSGKTHLTRIWSQRTNARILRCRDLEEPGISSAARGRAAAVLNADRMAGVSEQETGLFHLCNTAAETGGRLLLTSRRSPAFWPVRLADLKSRLQASRQVSIGAPDDRLLAAVIVKLFSDRQISVAPNVVEYILPRMERSFEAAEALVGEMDRRGLARSRRITRATAAESLAAVNSGTAETADD